MMKRIVAMFAACVMLFAGMTGVVAETEVYTLKDATIACLIETESGLTTASITKAKADELEALGLGEYIVVKKYDLKEDNTAWLTTNTAGVVTLMYGIDNQWRSELRASGQRDLATVHEFFDSEGFLKMNCVRHGHTDYWSEIGKYYKLFVKVFWVYDEDNFRVVANGVGTAPVVSSGSTKKKTTTTTVQEYYVQPQVTQPPVTQPPVTQPPVTQPPVTQPPVTQPPVTQPPVTQPPVTQPPVTQPPVMPPEVDPTNVTSVEDVYWTGTFFQGQPGFSDQVGAFGTDSTGDEGWYVVPTGGNSGFANQPGAF